MLKHRGPIRDLFAPGPDLEADLRAFAGALATGRPRIGVHVRMTDYRTHMGGAYFLGLDRTRAEMAAVRERLGRDPLFVIFSDEPRRADEFPGFDVALSAGSPVQDLHRMSRLDGLMGPLSTFSLWASYFGGIPLYQFGPAGHADDIAWIAEGLPVLRDPGAFAAAVESGARE
jgi:hypothetical protein